MRKPRKKVVITCHYCSIGFDEYDIMTHLDEPACEKCYEVMKNDGLRDQCEKCEDYFNPDDLSTAESNEFSLDLCRRCLDVLVRKITAVPF